MIMLWSDFLNLLTAIATILLAYTTYKSLNNKSKK